MKVIAINRNQFYAHPEKAWAEIYDLLQSNMDSPIFIDSKWMTNSDKFQFSVPAFSCIDLKKFLYHASGHEKKNYLELLQQTKDLDHIIDGEKLLCLDLRGLSKIAIVGIANAIAKTAYTMLNRPTVYVLLVDDTTGSVIAESWYRAFYIEPYLMIALPKYLSQTFIKLRLRAFVLRYFGVKIGKLLQRVLYRLYK